MKDQILRKKQIISFLLIFLLTSFIGLTDAVAQNYASTTVNDGLMAYYPFDGNANDASGNGYHATPCNNFQYEEGVVGASIAVVGEGHCVSTGGHVLLPEFDFDVSSGVTLSLWVKALSLSNEEGETYISLGTSVVFEKDYHSERLDILQMPTTISFDYRETEITIPFEDSYVGTWVMYTLACSSDGTMRAYVNGELVGEANVDYDGQLYASLAALGRHWWDYYDGMRTSTRFTGSFDEVRIYNRAITSQEVSLLYNSNHNEGTLPGLFSVGENTQVYFSQGNLQYQASTNTWRFAENQWDFVGEANSNASSTYEGWIDLFAWATSGYDHSSSGYQPWSNGCHAYDGELLNLCDRTGMADWGYNAISNGGNQERMWRTCTDTEWVYLMNNRLTASGVRFVKAKVNEINGIILFPDNWDASLYSLNNANDGVAAYSGNVVSLETWISVFEANDAVFLPAAGRKETWANNDFNECGVYWYSTSHYVGYLKGRMIFGGDFMDLGAYFTGEHYSVRLVRPAQTNTTYSIEAISNPVEGGSVEGAGIYDYYASANLTAIPNDGYTFVCWKENGRVVSKDNSYEVLALFDRNLEAYFTETTNAIVFADDNVKAICVEHWDTNGDGELSYAEAAAVTNLENVFAGNHEIVSFDEFQYFTGVTAINSYDFESCSLTSIVLPNTITTIGYAAFHECASLNSIIIPNSVTTIEGFAFAGCCGISSIEIPSSVTFIDIAFCSDGLEQIVVDPENTVYDSRENCNAIIETNSNRMVLGCNNTVIPNSVTSIGNSAFGGCTSLTSIEIPNSVTVIEDYAFRGTGLTLIEIPNSVNYIGGEVFSGCSDLVQMVVASGNTVYDSRGNCNAIIETSNNKLISGCKNTVIPNTVTSIGGYAFENCIMTSITIPSSVTSIDFAAFVYCTNLASITALSVTPPTLGGDVFKDVDKSIPVYVPSGSVSAYQSAEGWNEFTNILPIDDGMAITFADPNVKAICVEHWDTNGDGELSYAEAAAVTDLEGAFYGNQAVTSFDELQYFTGLTLLGGDLNNCRNLHSVVLPSTLTHLGTDALGGCGLSSIIIPRSVTTIDGGLFNWTSSLEQIIVEEGNPVYDSRENCNAVVETSTNKIIAGCKNTTYPSSITTIGGGAFFGDRSSTAVTIPSTIISLLGNPFPACDVLEQIIVEAGNPVYDSRNNCNAIIETSNNKLIGGCKNTVIPNTVTTIEGDAFHQDYSLTSIVIPSSVTTIESGAFCYTGLSEITIYAENPPLLEYPSCDLLSMPIYIPCGSLEAYQNAASWSEFTNFIEMCSSDAPVGAINGLFSVGEDTQVYFSQGSLQYQASTNTWRFAENQWDYVGAGSWGNVYENGVKCDNENISASYSGWIDLFGWGTSGFNHGAVCYQPWSTSTTFEDYYVYGSYTHNLYDQTGLADWGSNRISNSDNTTKCWRTLTRPEWEYLFYTRNTASGIRYAKAVVNGVNGIIFLPDNWSSSTYPLYSTNSSSASYSRNVISLSQWSTLEQNGAVFLPAAGFRLETTYYFDGYYGDYWTSTYHDEDGAWDVDFNDNYISSDNDGGWRIYGFTVRLVRPAQEVASYTINAVPNPAAGGTIIGAGTFQENATCTLTATANLGYVFQNWTENNEVVSTDATYSFTVTGDHNLVANFIAQGEAPVGAVQGLFSVSEDQQVYFSQGNLQYQASTNTWRFADNQWDIIGDDNTLITQTFDGWIDLFSWGTSGYDHGAVCYQPWILEMSGQFNHAAYGCDACGLRDNTGQADWGYNSIQNGGNLEHLWNTLTIQEWQYVLNTRITTSGMRYAKAVVNGVKGLIIFPDDWESDVALINNANSSAVSYNTNVISAQEWSDVMEVHGAVFLPAAGKFHGGDGLLDVGVKGSYWSSTSASSYLKSLESFSEESVTSGSFYPHCRYSVRLVRFTNTITAFSIEANPNPSEAGSVTGAGSYYLGATATLNATPNMGYVFLNWTENGEVVSTNATFSFTVSGNRSLVANFIAQGGVPTGAILAPFTVNGNGGQVYFSLGNLQYQASTDTWRFAENQWDFVGNETYGTVYENGEKCNNSLVSATYDGWIDLFGWGTSGYNHGAVSYQPWSVSNNNSDYYAYGSPTYNLFDQNGTADWGYNAISNGGNQEGLWRSLTNDEWKYLLNQRNTSSGILYAKATVNDVCGVLLLPDNWNASTYNLTNTNNESASYNYNVITLEEWENILQNAGVVFLPACWSRVGTQMDLSRYTWGQYWTASYINSYMAYPISFSSGHLDPCSINGYDERRNGQGVRLVCTASAATSYSINAVPNPAEGGSVTGAGTYQANAICTLTATSNPGYTFLNWLENGEEVSTNVTYTFTVTDNRTLTANFVETVSADLIVFADDNVKAICVEHWDTDGDGELSYAEAAAVTDIGQVFSDNWSITSFDEFQYFTGVTLLDQYAFGWTSLSSIVIPGSVTTIDAAFYDCRYLVSILIPQSVTSISSSAFSGCDVLEQIIVEAGNPVYDSRDNCNAIIRTSNNELIQGCKNTIIPNTVTAIGWGAFSLIGGLTSITIPESVLSISYTSFYACSGLERIIVSPNNPVYDSRGNCNAIIESGSNKLIAGSKSTVIPNTVTSIGTYAFSYRYDGGDYVVTIPSSVTVLENSAFLGCRSMVSITIPHTVVSIGDYCFEECWNLESMTVLAMEPPVVGQNAFEEVNKDLLLTVPCGVSDAYQDAAGWSEFTNIQEDCATLFVINVDLTPNASGTVTGAGTYQVNATCTLSAMPYIGYTFLNWTENGEEISSDATYSFTVTGHRNLTANFLATASADYIVFADPATKAICVEHWDINGDGELSYAEAAAVTEWHGEFDYASITSFDELQYFTGLTTVGFYITYYMTSVILPNSITRIGYYGFAWCNALTSIVIPNSVTTIDANAFIGCEHMSSVTIGNSVTEIHDAAFHMCTGLETIYVLAETPPTLGADVFNYVDKSIPVHVPCGTLNAYLQADGWNEFTNIQEDCIGQKNISVMANPSEGGVVTGAGNYTVGSTATLSTMANQGYVFNNWTENGEVISTDVTYSFTVTCDRMIVANFTEATEPGANHWIPEAGSFEDNMTFTAVIQINGVEQHSEMLEVGAFCGAQCRGSQLAVLFEPTQRHIVQLTIFGEIGDLISFRLYDHATVQELELTSPAPVIFNTNGFGTLASPYVLNFTTANSQVQVLSGGWNWWSTAVELEGNNGLAQLENSLGENGLIIKSRNDGYVEPFDYNGSIVWFGPLEAIHNDQFYKVSTSSPCVASINGIPTNPADHPITLNSGWNWIGFPSQQSASLRTALSGLNPEPDDIIKGRNGFASYYAEDGYSVWYGTLNTLEAGQGYMYQSKYNGTKTFTYNIGKGETAGANITSDNNYNRPNTHQFADNMTIIAVVELEGKELSSDAYELAAFVGDECRGSVKLLYMPLMKRYVAYLTVFGESLEQLRFEITDGTVKIPSDDEMAFVNDGTAGTLSNPVILHFNSTSVVDNTIPNLTVRPNPSSGVFMIEGTGIERVEVFNALGQKVLVNTDRGDSVKVDLSGYASGLYLVRAISSEGLSNITIIKN